MKKNFTLLVSFLAINMTLFSQTVAEVSSKATQHYLDGAYEQAAETFEAAAGLSWLPAERQSLFYNAACSHALSGNKEGALQNLELAISDGFSNKQHLKKDHDLRILWEDPRWPALLETVKEISFSSTPGAAGFHVEDIEYFYRALEMALEDSLRAPEIFKQEYILKGSVGLQDFYASKILELQTFSD